MFALQQRVCCRISSMSLFWVSGPPALFQKPVRGLMDFGEVWRRGGGVAVAYSVSQAQVVINLGLLR
jgi:hypothetical protein